MSGVKINNIVKRSISLSPLVNQWANEMAAKRGFGTNFSAFLADLVRRAQEQDAASSATPDTLADAIVSGAISESAATPAPGPVGYGSKRKAARPAKAPRAGGSPKKAP